MTFTPHETNTHLPVVTLRGDDQRQFEVRCSDPSCDHYLFGGGLDPDLDVERRKERAAERMLREHTVQYEPGRAPDIEVDWEPSAWCPICDTFADLRVEDADTLVCERCDTYWDMSGRHGQREDAP